MTKAARKPQEVSFECPESERKIVRAIARRARDLLLEYGVDRPALDIDMDIVATHCTPRTSSTMDAGPLSSTFGILAHAAVRPAESSLTINSTTISSASRTAKGRFTDAHVIQRQRRGPAE
jgi:hypothetical protein